MTYVVLFFQCSKLLIQSLRSTVRTFAAQAEPHARQDTEPRMPGICFGLFLSYTEYSALLLSTVNLSYRTVNFLPLYDKFVFEST